MTTPMTTRLTDRLQDRRSYFGDWLARWHGIRDPKGGEIDLFNGKKGYWGGLRYEGSIRDQYWAALVKGLKKDVIDQFARVEVEARAYGRATALLGVDECAGALISFVRAVRQKAVEKDRILRGDGVNFPPASDGGHWEDLAVSTITGQADAIKAGLIELFAASTTAESRQMPGLTDIDIARRRMLLALLIAHDIQGARVHDLDGLNEEYAIGLPDNWLASSVAPWTTQGWVRQRVALDGTVSAQLVAAHYGDALDLVMGWLNADSLTIDPVRREIRCSRPVPEVLPTPPDWTWVAPPAARPVNPAAADSRLIALDHSNPELLGLREELRLVIETVRGDNELEHRDDVLRSLDYTQMLLERAQLTLAQIRVGLAMTLDDAIHVAARWGKVVIIETFKASLVEWLRKQGGF